MRFGSCFSGIEAASLAWNPLGWKAQWLAEIAPFPCSVLKHHYPDTPNLGDVTKFNDWPTDDKHAIDLLCGGTPCQSFSVAGLRKGLDDPRGNLMLTFGAIAAKYRPKWLVWENVPGVLSSNGGRDFGSFLGMLGQLGYGFAYRILDAQYFGVAQRRRRVFVVGCLGDWRSAAAVLFERHSLQGHPAPRRQAGQVITPTIRAGASNGGAGHGARSGDSKDELIVPVVGTLCVATGQAGAEIGAEIAPTLNCNHEAPYAMYQTAHTLRGEGFDASEDGTGRGTPLVPVCTEVGMTLTSGGNGARGRMDPVNTDLVLIPIAFPERMSGTQCASTVDLAPSMGALNQTAIAFQERGRADGPNLEIGGDLAFALTAPNGGGRAQERNILAPSMQVRRLTPRECERLQGFPDDYTLTPGKRKTIRPEKLDIDYIKYLARGGVMTFEQCCTAAADGPRYKAIGNSWAVPCAAWLGKRIQEVEEICIHAKLAA